MTGKGWELFGGVLLIGGVLGEGLLVLIEHVGGCCALSF